MKWTLQSSPGSHDDANEALCHGQSPLTPTKLINRVTSSPFGLRTSRDRTCSIARHTEVCSRPALEWICLTPSKPLAPSSHPQKARSNQPPLRHAKLPKFPAHVLCMHTVLPALLWLIACSKRNGPSIARQGRSCKSKLTCAAFPCLRPHDTETVCSGPKPQGPFGRWGGLAAPCETVPKRTAVHVPSCLIPPVWSHSEPWPHWYVQKSNATSCSAWALAMAGLQLEFVPWLVLSRSRSRLEEKDQIWLSTCGGFGGSVSGISIQRLKPRARGYLDTKPKPHVYIA